MVAFYGCPIVIGLWAMLSREEGQGLQRCVVLHSVVHCRQAPGWLWVWPG